MPEKSTHHVEVVPITLRPHPNADRLAIADVFGYQCVVGKVVERTHPHVGRMQLKIVSDAYYESRAA